MANGDWQRAAAMYFPLMAAIIARLMTGSRPRQLAACLLSILWVTCSLSVLQKCNQYAGWWVFASGSAAYFQGMPLELFFGWIILWGLLPQLLFPRFSIAGWAILLIGLDCLLMPLLNATVSLGPQWLIGEVAAVFLVLIPALCVGRWTTEQTNLGLRAALQVAVSGLLFLFLLPEITFSLQPGSGWSPLLHLSSWLKQISLQAVFILALPGISAVIEFVERGRGTPLPYDPPQLLVTSGVYRYCANPMQLSCLLVMLAWAALLANPWLLLAAGASLIYSAGIAEWDEKEDLELRFGQNWRDYRASVPRWWPRWTPFHAGGLSFIYIAKECGPCREVRTWLEAKMPTGLQIIDAETLPANSIRRIRYDPRDGTPSIDGVRAVGRALEHLHLGWALIGFALRLPIVWRIIQLLMDASGMGARDLVSGTQSIQACGSQAKTSAMLDDFQ